MKVYAVTTNTNGIPGTRNVDGTDHRIDEGALLIFHDRTVVAAFASGCWSAFEATEKSE